MARRPAFRATRPLRYEALESRELLAADFGDAPAPYATLLAADGAWHEAVGPLLGSARDAEIDGAPSAAADGDGEDDDGVRFSALRVGQASASIVVVVTGAPAGAKLDAWIDFNRDGSWGGPGEQIFASATLVSGEQQLAFSVPSWAAAGETVARFRLSTAGGLGWKGPAADGEVEDYRVSISGPGVGEGEFRDETRLPGAQTLSAPRSLLPVDMDGDGDLDLVTGRSFTAWYENQGGSFAARTLTFSQYWYDRATAADLDGDGDIDVIGTTASSAHLERNNGTGTFTRTTLVGTLAGGVPISTADVDGDGDLDLVGGGSLTSRVAWYENNGAEQFQRREFPDPWDDAAGIAAVDFDTDGDLDFLVSAWQGVGWYENDGASAFALHMLVEGRAGRAVPRDVDADGDQDFIVSQGSAIHWYENDGEQSFSAHAVASGLSNSYVYVDAADMDGDGDVDLISTANNKVAWHENAGDATFTTHELSPAEGAVLVAAADLNGDGVLDIVSGSTSGNKFAWRRQLSPLDFGDAPAPYPTTIDENGAQHVPVGPKLGALRDTETDALHGDDDADDDGVTFSSVSIAGGLATVTVNVSDAPAGALVSAWLDFDRDGNWAGANEVIALDRPVVEGSNVLEFSVPAHAVPGLTYARVRLSTAAGLTVVGAAPDGEVEDYAVEIEPAALATGSFGAGQTIAAGDWSYPTDLDRDGDLDLLVPTGWLENDGSGGMAPHNIFSGIGGTSPYFAFHASDLDGDGDVDFLSSGARVYWYENLGNQTFERHDTNIVSPGYFIDPPVAADIDGDNDIDVAAVDSGRILHWYRNDGALNFTAIRVTPTSGGYPSASVTIADVDHDGDLDFITPIGDSTNGSNRLAWHENAGGAILVHLVTVSNSIAERFDTVVAGDVDGDGDGDLLAAGRAKLTLLVNDGAQNFTPLVVDTAESNRGWPGLGLRLADLDGDGDLDIATALRPIVTLTRSLVVLQNQGGLSFVKRTLSPAPTGFTYSLWAADLTGDGAVDVISGGNGIRLFAGEPIVGADYGDAPAPYPTLRSESGAAHGGGGPTLGALHSADGSGAHSPLADADASDDGVTFGPLRVGQASGTITVDVRNAPLGARVDAWIDFNGDGTWNQAGEQILARASVVEGENTLTFTAPAGAVAGTTFARVRLSTAGGLSPKGAAIDGEVEDYALHIEKPAEVMPEYGAFQIAWSSSEILRPADVDGDGDLDILTTNRFGFDVPWRQNLGGGAFLSQLVTTGLTINSGQVGVEAADLDRDGDLDVAFANVSQIGWYENNGGETFRRRLITFQGESKSLKVVDLDGDGDLDLLTARSGVTSVGAIVAFMNDGAGGFTPRYLVEANTLPVMAEAADLDGDGDLDVAAAFDTSVDGIRWYENDGGVYVEHTIASIRAPLLVPVDLDRDGDFDLVTGLGLGALPSTLSWLENDGAGSFTVRTVGAADPFSVTRVSRERVAARDVDGDGDVDLAVADRTRVWVFRNDGAQEFSKDLVIEDPAADFVGVALADLNGDGRLEILASDALHGGGWFEARARGDYNRDGYVNDADLQLWQSTLGQPVDFPGAGADGNHSGAVNEDDRDVALASFGAAPYAAARAANVYLSPQLPSGEIIDGADFLHWQRRVGLMEPAMASGTDWNANGIVDSGDLDVWKGQLGQGVVLDSAWMFSMPGAVVETVSLASEPDPSEHTAEDLAATRAALDAVYAAGDFTTLFAEETEAAGASRRVRRRATGARGI
jgi:hypothetical protein